jgi:hypothetical protein
MKTGIQGRRRKRSARFSTRFTALASNPAPNTLQHMAVGNIAFTTQSPVCIRLVHGRVGSHSKMLKQKSWLLGMGSNHDSEKVFGICKLRTIKTCPSHESHPFQPVMCKVCTREKSGMNSRSESMPGASSQRVCVAGAPLPQSTHK